jgi:hypothetical protein
MRLQANRLDVDLMISTVTAAKADCLRGMSFMSSRGTIHVGVVSRKSKNGVGIAWLFSEGQRPWARHGVLGHLHDCGINGDNTIVEFHWTALLGRRQPMLDYVLDAFTQRPAPASENPRYYPAGGMFWESRGTQERLSEIDSTRSPRMLRFACDVAGLTQAVTRVHGVFL